MYIYIYIYTLYHCSMRNSKCATHHRESSRHVRPPREVKEDLNKPTITTASGHEDPLISWKNGGKTMGKRKTGNSS